MDDHQAAKHMTGLPCEPDLSEMTAGQTGLTLRIRLFAEYGFPVVFSRIYSVGTI